MFVQVSLLGGGAVLSHAQALDAMRRRANVYRSRVQDGLISGLGLDGAHQAARPLLDEARSALRAAGMTDGQASDAIAREFHA